MNSFNFIARGIEAEVERQIDVWESGGEVEQETYDFDAATGTLTRAAREGGGRRLPLLPGAGPRAGRAARGARRAPARRAARAARRAHPPDRADPRPRAGDCARHGRPRPLWEETVAAGADGRRRGERHRERSSARGSIRPRSSRASSRSSSRRATRIPRAAFDEAIAKVGEPGFSADPYLAQEAVSDTASSSRSSTRSSRRTRARSSAYRGGKEGLLGFFVGQVMKETQGKANARVVSELVREKLAG